MRIALVKCPRDASGLFSENSESLALGYLAAAVRLAGHEVEILNGALRGLGAAALDGHLISGGFDLIGFNISDPSLVRSTLASVRALRAARVQSHLCAGGHTATFHADEILTECHGLDSIALFESEETLCDLVARLAGDGAWREVPGLCFRNGDRIAHSSPRPQRADLDGLAFPARDDLDWVLSNMDDVGAVPVLASRGCYFNCSFCSVRSFYQKDGLPTWRRRSVHNVLDEIGQLLKRPSVTDILFVDDLFVSRSGPTLRYAEEFARAILRHGYRFTFTISATVDSIRPGTFELLREAGLRQVFVGAESASPEILRSLHKWFEPDAITRGVKVLNDLGLVSSVSYINFTPASNLHHLRENLKFFCQLGTNILQGLLNRYQVYAGTPLFGILRQQGRLRGSFPFYDYQGVDDRVELVYCLCKQALGSLIELHYELKRLERKVFLYLSQRRRYGEAPGQSEAEEKAHLGDLLKAFERGINEDVAELFGSVLDFVEGRELSVAAASSPAFVNELRVNARTVADEWLGSLRFFDTTLRLGKKEQYFDRPTHRPLLDSGAHCG
jgi:Radical SAM superfamily/B12 binding domain